MQGNLEIDIAKKLNGKRYRRNKEMKDFTSHSHKQTCFLETVLKDDKKVMMFSFYPICFVFVFTIIITPYKVTPIWFPP